MFPSSNLMHYTANTFSMVYRHCSMKPITDRVIIRRKTTAPPLKLKLICTMLSTHSSVAESVDDIRFPLNVSSPPRHFFSPPTSVYFFLRRHYFSRFRTVVSTYHCVHIFHYTFHQVFHYPTLAFS